MFSSHGLTTYTLTPYHRSRLSLRVPRAVSHLLAGREGHGDHRDPTTLDSLRSPRTGGRPHAARRRAGRRGGDWRPPLLGVGARDRAGPGGSEGPPCRP